jgi:hypothetical protein
VTAVFGDFLHPAAAHIAAAVACPGDLPDDARTGVIQHLTRLTAPLARYAADIPLSSSPCTSAASGGTRTRAETARRAPRAHAGTVTVSRPEHCPAFARATAKIDYKLPCLR